jgi:ribosomal protein S12 methylthiotransferase accessory factor
MAKATEAHAVRLPSSRSLLVVGISLQHVLGKRFLNKSRSSVKFVPDISEAGGEHRFDLAVGVHSSDDLEGRRSYALWAQRTGTPALHVVLDGSEELIGPLALPGVSGCGYCAWARMFAAGVYRNRQQSAASDSVADVAGPLLSREIQAILKNPKTSRLLQQVLAIDAGSGNVSLHRFIPLDHCPVCGGASAHPVSEQQHTELSAEDDPGVVLNALAGWVDPVTGVLPRIVVEKPSDTGLDLPIVVTVAPPHVVEDSGELRRLPVGWGKGLTLSGAILSAVGEAIERYAPSLPDPARIRWAPADELDGPYLDPRNCSLYVGDQYDRQGFPYTRFDPKVRHPWVLGRWLQGETGWVPAIMTFLSLTLWREHMICQGTSNGLAAANTLERAALRAMLELVERDAFMTAWLTGSRGTPLMIDGESELQEIVAGIEALGATVELYSLESACGTTVLCLALGDGRRYPGATIGLGTDLDPQSAARQAVLELGQTGPHLRRMMLTGTYQVPGAPHQVREMLDHAAYYFPAEHASAFDRLRSTATGVSIRSLPVSKRGLADELRSAGIRVALVDVTSPDVATGPFRVVRAVSPDLQPISYGYGLDRAPVERIAARGIAVDVPTIHPIW